MTVVKNSIKSIPQGVTLVQPLNFGDWPLEKVQEVIADIESRYDMSKHELDYVSRGGWQKCQGYADHEPCDEIVPTMGKIVWKRVKV